MSDNINQPLSRLMAAVRKSKMYKDARETAGNIAMKTLDCAAQTTSKANKHYVAMRKKYDEDEYNNIVEKLDQAQQHKDYGRVSNISELGSKSVKTQSISDTIENLPMDTVIIPNYRIIKHSHLSEIAKSETLNESIVCLIEIPGVKSSSIELTFFYSEMTICAKKHYPVGLGNNNKSNENVSQCLAGNTQYGTIACKIQLPINVNEPHKVETNYTDGVLSVLIPTTQYIEPVILKYKKSRSKNI